MRRECVTIPESLQEYKTVIPADQARHSIYLWGGVGAGKSSYAASIARQLRSQARWFRWVAFPALIAELRNNVDESLTTINEIKSFPGVLILDDFGATADSPFLKDCVYAIIDHRSVTRLPTVITSNLSLKDVGDRIDDRIASRIAGMCNGGKNVRHFTGDKRIGT